MDIGVKERLTGALILIALLVWLVPEILNGPAERDVGAGQAADGPPLRSYSMDLGADAGHVAQDQSTLAPQQAQSPEPAATPETGPPPTEPPPAARAATPEPEPPAPKPSSSPTPPSTAAVQPAPKAAPAAAEQPVAAGSWWVQIGTFSQSANAQRLLQQLTTKGFRARVSPVTSKGKELFRVRAGPVGDRAAAEALQTRLAAAGHKGTLVAP